MPLLHTLHFTPIALIWRLQMLLAHPGTEKNDYIAWFIALFSSVFALRDVKSINAYISLPHRYPKNQIVLDSIPSSNTTRIIDRLSKKPSLLVYSRQAILLHLKI